MKITIGNQHIDINDDFIKATKNSEKFVEAIVKLNPGFDKETVSEKLKDLHQLFHDKSEKKV